MFCILSKRRCHMANKVLKTLCVFFLMPVFIFCGCESGKEKKSLVTDFTADFSSTYRESDVRGSVSTNRQGVISIRITYPETVDGLNISYKDSQMEISRETLICSADEAYLPQRSFPSQLKLILTECQTAEQHLCHKTMMKIYII